MSLREFAGAAPTTALSAGINNTDLAFTVTSGGGTGYPTGGTAPFIVCLDRGNAGEEKILCTRTGDTFTVVTRGYDDTVASSHSINAPVDHVGGAIDFREANTHINATANAHAATAISNTPAGNIAATTVQAALNELDSEKLATTAAAELIRDTIGTALVAGSGVTITVNDGADTITLATGGLLGYCQYNPGTEVNKLTASLTYAALDTTNLRVTFVAPASGVVKVEYGAWGSNNTVNSNGPSLGVLDGSTLKAQSGYMGNSHIGESAFGPICVVNRVSGLTPGATYTWDLAYASSQTANVVIAYGGPADGTGKGAAYLFVSAA